MNTQIQNPHFGTPEGHLVACKAGELDTDAIQCAVARANALINLVVTQFDGDCDKLSNEIMINALWGIEGYLDQIKILTENQ